MNTKDTDKHSKKTSVSFVFIPAHWWLFEGRRCFSGTRRISVFALAQRRRVSRWRLCDFLRHSRRRVQLLDGHFLVESAGPKRIGRALRLGATWHRRRNWHSAQVHLLAGGQELRGPKSTASGSPNLKRRRVVHSNNASNMLLSKLTSQF